MSRFPILFSPSETEFSGHGIGVLSDAIECTVKGEINGIYDLELIYPISGEHLSKITGRSIIYAQASPFEGCQPFRVYDITEKIDGRVGVMAHHISYDLSGIPVTEINAESSDEALIQIAENSATDNPFTFDCQYSVEGNCNALVPRSARSRLIDKSESILSAYGGEFHFDHFKVEYKQFLGQSRGYHIKYGVNLVDLTQERNFDEMYTGIYPYYAGGESYIELPEKIVNAEGEFGFTKIKVVNLSSEFSQAPDADLLRAHAQRYISEHKIGVPTVSIDLTHAHLTRFGDFCSASAPEDVGLGDTVIVEYPRYNIAVSARVHSFKYDSLKKRYISIGIGDTKQGFIKTLHQLKRSGGVAADSKQIASDANKAASAAQAVAASAKSIAENAVSTSNDATDTANKALDSANSAVETAAQAKEAAEAAEAVAESASSAANEANTAVALRVKIEDLENGSAKIAGMELPTVGSEGGTLTGVWGAIPQGGGDPSRIVTLQDLYNWGILT